MLLLQEVTAGSRKNHFNMLEIQDSEVSVIVLVDYLSTEPFRNLIDELYKAEECRVALPAKITAEEGANMLFHAYGILRFKNTNDSIKFLIHEIMELLSAARVLVS